MRKVIILISVMCLVSPIIVFGRIGVGVTTGRIQLDEPLKAGGVYDLPFLSIVNTGDEPSTYEVRVEYHEGVPELRPAREWFRFNPKSFDLEPSEAQKIQIQLTLPFNAKPGNYFAYLEGRPAIKVQGGVANIGVAAAAKLYFTVAPANIFQALYYRISYIFEKYSPWSWIVLALVILAIIITAFKKFFKFQIGISRKQAQVDKEVVYKKEGKTIEKNVNKSRSRKTKKEK